MPSTIPTLRGLALAGCLALSFSATASLPARRSTKPLPKTQTTTKRTGGKVWDKKKKECVTPNKQSFNDDDLYRAAREFSYAGQVRHRHHGAEARPQPG